MLLRQNGMQHVKSWGYNMPYTYTHEEVCVAFDILRAIIHLGDKKNSGIITERVFCNELKTEIAVAKNLESVLLTKHKAAKENTRLHLEGLRNG